MGTPVPAPTPAVRLVGFGCCRPYEGPVLMSWTNLTWTECRQECMKNSACNAFAPSGCRGMNDRECGGGCHIYRLSSTETPRTDVCMETNGFTGIGDSTYCYTVQ